MIGKGVRLERHRELGRRLRDLNNELVDLQHELTGAYPGSRTIASHLRQLTRGLANLRDELDEALWAEHPTKADRWIYHQDRWREYDG